MRRLAVVLALLVGPACAVADAPEGADLSAKPADPYGATVTAAGPASDVTQRVSVALSPPAFPRAPVAAPVMMATFEAASAVCNDWAAEGADAIRSVPPHSGSYACRICATGEAPTIAIGHGTGPLTAGRYLLTAWVRTRPNNVGPEAATARLEADTASGVVAATSPIVLGNDYALLQVTLDLPQPATAIRARIGAVARATQCVLIDDVFVQRLD